MSGFSFVSKASHHTWPSEEGKKVPHSQSPARHDIRGHVYGTAPITKCNISEKIVRESKFYAGASAVVGGDRGIAPHNWLPTYRVVVQGSTTRYSKRQEHPSNNFILAKQEGITILSTS